MKRLLTAGIFGTILGIVGAYSTANASIVSSGFLDERLTEYALSTSLDLKANQSDLNFIGMEVDPALWNDQRESEIPWSITNAAPIIEELFPNFVDSPYAPSSISGTLLSSLRNIEAPGIAGFTNKLLNGWTSTDGTTYLGIKDLNTQISDLPKGNLPQTPVYELLFPLNGLDTIYPTSLHNLITVLFGDGKAYPGIINLFAGGFSTNGVLPFPEAGIIPAMEVATSAQNTANIANAKIGTLPTEIVIGNSNGAIDMFNSITKLQKVSLPKDYTLSDFIQDMYYGSFGDNAGLGKSPFYGLSDIIERVMYGGIIGGSNPDLAGKEYKGLINLTLEVDQISEVPTGNLPPSPIYEQVFPLNGLPTAYPTSLYDLITVLFGDGKAYPGIINLFAGGFSTDGVLPFPQAGIIPAMNVATSAQFAADSIKVEIGTLPREIPNVDSTWARYGFVETTGTPIDLPDTIGGMFAMLFNEDGLYNGPSLRNIMARILLGFDRSGARTEGLVPLTSAYNLTGDSPIVNAVKANTAAIEKIGTVPDGQTVAGMATTAKTTADSAIEKIGTLPTEYATVGAALSAIKGIAEEAKTAALAAIPDPKQEGSSGKFVLTVDIIGDNATYRWEKIDRESEPTTTE